MFEKFVLLNDGHPIETEAIVAADTVFLGRDRLLEAVGWELRPEGLCRGGMCIVVPHSLGLETEWGVDLQKVALLLQRPLALSLPHRAGYLGVSAVVRAEALARLEAPDFMLPDLAGKLYSLSDFRGRKVVLVAHASW